MPPPMEECVMKHHSFFVRYLCVILFVVAPQLVRAQSDPNPNCSLIVPNNPLSAEGLAAPYQLVADRKSVV